jgi:hypothetical protein
VCCEGEFLFSASCIWLEALVAATEIDTEKLLNSFFATIGTFVIESKKEVGKGKW